MSINFNAAPYFDDFSEDKKFVKILYRPRYAVQTRELNQMQTQIQNQIEKFGKGIYKDGSVVIPGGISYNKNFNYVKLTESITTVTFVDGQESATAVYTDDVDQLLSTLIGYRVEDANGVTGILKAYQLQTSTTPLTLFVEYETSGEGDLATNAEAFSASNTLTIKPSNIDLTDASYTAYRVVTASQQPTGFGSAVEIERGVYFIRGYFLLIEKQTLILDAYSNVPSYSVGFRIKEEIITPEEDSSLYDNANGSFNFSAPGAHRYVINLDLEKIPLSELENQNDDTYIELLQTKEGENKKHETRTAYSEIGKEFARRTYDESGDYTVTSFRMSAVESRNNDRGEWAANETYLIGDIVTSNNNTYVAKSNGVAGNARPTQTFGESSDGNVTWLYTESPEYNNGHSLTGNEDEVIIAAEPGKAYVRGYEIEKPSTTYIPVKKARTFNQINNDVIATSIGNFVRIRDLKGAPDIKNLSAVDLKLSDDTVVGTARIRAIEPFGASDFNLYLFDVNLNAGIAFERDVKQIVSTTFSCVTSNIVTQDANGSVTTSSSTVNGTGTRFSTDFKVNDYIDINNTYYQITAITNDNQMTVSGTPNVTDSAYKLHRTVIQDPSRNVSLFPLGRSFIKSTKNETEGVNTYDTRYTIIQSVTSTSESSGNTVEFDTSTVSGDEIAGSPEDIVICANNTSGDFISATPTISGNTITVTDASIVNGQTYTAYFPIRKNTPATASPKTKELNSTIEEITAQELYELRTIELSKADILRINKIEMTDSEGIVTDVTEHFDLDNGQRDSYYDLGKIVRKPNYGIPTGKLKVYYEYFDHGTETGDYFSVDSYINVRREEIPQYSSIYGVIYLTDVLDFRPVIKKVGGVKVFNGSGLAYPPKRGTATEADYTYYLPRVDKISLDIEGKFIVSEGTPGEVASEPETPDLSMHLATITVAPYTYNTNYINIKKVDNRRYTMRDIGKIERRVDNLEYYTSLSLLEQEASTLNIPDAETGLSRFKNGFIVDNFSGHTVGDTISPDYKASIDMEMKELRPTFIMDNVKLLESASTDGERFSQGYQLTGDIITLPYTENEFIYQKYASRPENVNPFAIFTFIGSVDLNPPTDEWIETQRIPEIINDVEGNYSAILNAEKASGAFGTVWNAWQTQWTGQIVTGNTMVRAADWSTQDFGLGAGRWMARDTFTAAERNLIGSTPGGRVLTYEVVATQTGQTRTGINTEVRATFEKEFVNDRVVSRSVVPFIRSRKVAFLARGLKLQTIVYPFFDEVDVSSYITPATRISFTGDQLFDFETNVGQDNEELSRIFDDNVQTAYNKGDVVYVKQRNGVTYNSPENSPGTAVCILQEVQPGGDVRNILVVNVKGVFRDGDIIAGTISGSEGTVSGDVTVSQQGDRLVTNFGGDVAGVFDIPSTDALRFKTGNREFKLIDNQENNDLIAKTRGFGNYHAEGVLQTWQATYNSVRNAEVVRTTVTDERTIVTDERVGRIVRDTGWYDPLAQTFLVQNRGGAFITSVDIWFASVDPVKPITMQIREVVNGYPGKNILPFSNITLYPYELRDENQPNGYGLSSNTVDVEGGVWLAPDKPTKFKMKAPVYVQDVGEYCVVLLSNSNNYHVWTSELGGIDVTTSTPKLISEQPYAGVLFKSQNASTWTAHQNEDLMFRINIAEFETQGSAEFSNATIDDVTLDRNPFFFRQGSSYVRVFHNNHGMYTTGAKVTISRVATGTYNGIPSSQLNGTHTILHVEQDAYVIQVTSSATLTGRSGGTGIRASRNIKFDVLQPICQHQKFSDTSLDFFARTTSGRSIDGGQTAGNLSGYVPIIANENNEFSTPRMVASKDNQGNTKSFFLRANMQTNNSSLSPVIDTTRMSLITVSNRIDDPKVEDMNYPTNEVGFDIYNLFTGEVSFISFDGNKINVSDDEGTRNKIKTLRVGKAIKLFDGQDENTMVGPYIVTNVAEDGSQVTVSETINTSISQVQIRVYDNYVDELGPQGSASAKYLTRKINLAGSAATSTSLNIRFAADIPPGARVDVYYKIDDVGSATNFADIPWVYLDFANTNSRMTDITFNKDNLPEFNAAAVKLVMASNNSAAIPKVKDLIVIASV